MPTTASTEGDSGRRTPETSTPSPSRSSPDRSRRAIRSSLSTASQMVQEERNARFRNELLCLAWKPGLSAQEVQLRLEYWERVIIKTLHHWFHPELWAGFSIWRRRTWQHSILIALQANAAASMMALLRANFDHWRFETLLDTRAQTFSLRALRVVIAAWMSQSIQMKKIRRGVAALCKRSLYLGFSTWQVCLHVCVRAGGPMHQ